MNYYKRHLGDYAKDTGHLSALEHGVYTLLLDRYYSTERPIPEAEAHKIARARTREEREAADSVLREFFKLREGEWHHHYADRVIAAAQEKSDKAASSAHTRWHSGRNANASETHSAPDAKVMLATNPLATSQEKKTDMPAARAGFDSFKAKYPRREAWGRAEKAWKALKPDAATVALILAAIDRQRVSGCLQPRSADGRSLIPLPATWINDRRWLDQDALPASTAPKVELPRCKEPGCAAEGLLVFGGLCGVHHAHCKPPTAAQIAAGIGRAA